MTEYLEATGIQLAIVGGGDGGSTQNGICLVTVCFKSAEKSLVGGDREQMSVTAACLEAAGVAVGGTQLAIVGGGDGGSTQNGICLVTVRLESTEEILVGGDREQIGIKCSVTAACLEATGVTVGGTQLAVVGGDGGSTQNGICFVTVRLESTLVGGDCEQIGICSVTAAGVSVGGTQQAIVGEDGG